MKLKHLDNVEIDVKNSELMAEIRAEAQWLIAVADAALRTNSTTTGVSAAAPPTIPAQQDAISMAAKIRTAIANAPDHFKSSDIYNAFPPAQRTTVKSELQSLLDREEIEVVSKGRGRAPTVYRKLS